MLMSCTHVFIALYFPVLVVLFWNFVNKLLVHSALKSYKGAILIKIHTQYKHFFLYWSPVSCNVYHPNTYMYLLCEKYCYYFFIELHVNDLFIF